MDRRSLLLALGGAAVAGGRSSARAEAEKDLRSFGARGDGVADDTAALARAMTSGAALDGGGRIYGVRGALEAGANFRSLSRCTLVQLEAADHLQTLVIRGASNFRLSQVRVVRGRQNDRVLVQQDMQRNAGVWIEDGAGFRLDRVQVSGGGIGTGLVIAQSRAFSVTDARVSGIHYHLGARPTDDMLQGIWIQRCSGFDLTRPVVSDLGGQDDLGFSRDNNRAIAISGSSHFRITDLDVSQCGQGLDVTGKEGNHDFEVMRGHAADCFSWGFKFANSAQHGRLSGALAERCGLGGFVVSGPSQIADPPTQDIEIADCKAIDCGAQYSPHTTFGFGVLRGLADNDHPARVRFLRCLASDSRSPAGMKWGYFNEIAAPEGGPIVAEACVSRGAAVASYRGFRAR
jgi:hypothetical protein